MKISGHPREEGGLGEKCRYQIIICSIHLSRHVMGPCIYAKASREDLLGLPDKTNNSLNRLSTQDIIKWSLSPPTPTVPIHQFVLLVRAQLLSSPERLTGCQDSKSMPLPTLLPICSSALGTWHPRSSSLQPPASLESLERTIRLRTALLLYDGLGWVLQLGLGRKGWGAGFQT